MDYRLTLTYKGTHYSGWQKQVSAKTITGEIEAALLKLGALDFRVLGSGRTDAGVHAFGQVVKISTSLELEPERLRKALNAYLPLDIRVLTAVFSDAAFHPQIDATKKHYRYLFSPSVTLNPLLAEGVHFTRSDLDVEKMSEAARSFIGEYDFRNFRCTGTEVTTTKRTIYESSILPLLHPYGEEWPLYAFDVVGNGFLKQMVRQMMGALLCVGNGKIDQAVIQSGLEFELDHRPWATAPACGLYLVEVFY